MGNEVAKTARARRRRATGRGFTLVELMVVVFIAAVLAAVATPSMGRLIATQRVRAAAGDLHLALVRARSEAIKRNAPVTLSPVGGSWTAGWTVVDPENPDGAPLQVFPAPRGTTVTSSLDQVVYNGHGRTTLLGDERSFQVSASSAPVARCVLLDPSGRAAVKEGASC